jgi:hypothetical protein
MKYYNFELSCEPKVIGVRNGGSQGWFVEKKFKKIQNWNNFDDDIYFDKDKYKHINKYFPFKGIFELREDDFELEYFEFVKSAKITNFVSYAPCLCRNGHFLVDNKTKDLLLKLNLPPHQFFKVNEAYHREQKLANYYLFYLPALGETVINWSENIYYTGMLIENRLDLEFDDNKFVKHGNYNEYLEKSDVTTKLYRMSFKSNLINNYDIFRVVGGYVGLIVSERFKELYEKEGLTGADIYISKLPTFEFK